MQKRVTPIEPTSSIPDPQRGDMLPPKGRIVSWNAYWAGLTARGEITAVDEPEGPASEHDPSVVEPSLDDVTPPAGDAAALTERPAEG